MSGYLDRHRWLKGAAVLLRRYFDHHVARDSAALTYYLLFALFPLLIFLNNLIGLLDIDVDALLLVLSRIAPRDAVDLAGQYLVYISRVSSKALLWFGLIFSIYFPYRAVNALFQSVRKAYDAGMPLLIVTLVLALAVSIAGRRVLVFVTNYVYLSEGAVRIWTSCRFIPLGALLFAMIALLYALALDERNIRRGILPGVLIALAAWIGLSMLFSLYVERSARYSVIYGSIGGIIVMLLWLYLTASTLIMGAEFNSILLAAKPVQKRPE